MAKKIGAKYKNGEESGIIL